MAALPFDPSTFDVVWTAHTVMNIEDKEKLFAGMGRVLKTGGLLALYEVCAGDACPPYYPVPWASDAAISFLVSSEEMQRLLGAAGFTELVWRDVSAVSLDWLKRTIEARKAAGRSGGAPKVGLGVVLGKTAAEKSGNMVLNLGEDRIRIFQGVLQLRK